MNLEDRVQKLEGDEPERCENCIPWGDTPRVSYEDASRETSGPPQRCPECDFEPVHIVVTYFKEAGKP